MEFISHRGNTSGPNNVAENHPDVVLEVAKNHRVEVDVTKVGESYFLGHDSPKYEVPKSFLMDERLLIHCKTSETFADLADYSLVEAFYQTSEQVVLTSKGTLIYHSGHSPERRSRRRTIAVRLDAMREPIPFADALISDFSFEEGHTHASSSLPFDLLIVDIDGVMTDGTKDYDLSGGVMSKRFCDKDFTAIKRLKKIGVAVCFLSGDDQVNRAMAEKRGIDFYSARLSDGSLDKSVFVEQLRHHYRAQKIAYIGDDYYDLTIMDKVDFSFAPSDASPDVVNLASHVLKSRGGSGVLAELFEHSLGQFRKAFAVDEPLV